MFRRGHKKLNITFFFAAFVLFLSCLSLFAIYPHMHSLTFQSDGVIVAAKSSEGCCAQQRGTVAFYSSLDAPFYRLRPQMPVFRSRFYTSFPTSSAERKSNIALAARSLNNTLVPSGEEFSFNLTVGPRTEKRGYKTAKIIAGGKFIDGVGGGVCQVSTTLYNALLLSGLKITEYHPHSLPVGYVAPSFDAMVNSGSADLRFLNNTDNPIIIKAWVENDKLYVEVYGEKMTCRYERESVITGEIKAETEEIVVDDKGEYPELFEGERLVVSYSKNGYKSEGKLVKIVNGKRVWSKKVRSDSYKAVRGTIIEGRAKRPVHDLIESEEEVEINAADNI